MSRGLPYRTPEPDLVRAGSWLLDVGEGPRPLPQILPTWDYATELALERSVEVNAAEVLRQSGLEASTPLVLAVVWSSGQHLRGAAGKSRIHGTETAGVDLSFSLPGWDLGETLTLDTKLFLAQNEDARTDPVAFRYGSELWSDRKKVRLQGHAPRFPLALVDPESFGFPGNLPWMIQIRSDLDSPALGAIHLLVNENNSLVREAVESPTAGQEMSPILSAMYYDVGRTLIELALGHDELWTGSSFDDETLGRVLDQLLTRVFPHERPGAVRARRESDPAGYAASVAAAFGLMAER